MNSVNLRVNTLYVITFWYQYTMKYRSFTNQRLLGRPTTSYLIEYRRRMEKLDKWSTENAKIFWKEYTISSKDFLQKILLFFLALDLNDIPCLDLSKIDETFYTSKNLWKICSKISSLNWRRWEKTSRHWKTYCLCSIMKIFQYRISIKQDHMKDLPGT